MQYQSKPETNALLASKIDANGIEDTNLDIFLFPFKIICVSVQNYMCPPAQSLRDLKFCTYPYGNARTKSRADLLDDTESLASGSCFAVGLHGFFMWRPSVLYNSIKNDWIR